MTPRDRAAVRDALRSTSPDLLAYLERRVSVREDAADLLGEVLLQAWRRHTSLPAEPTRQRMWLFTIAAHVLANHRRSIRRRTSLAERLRAEVATTPPASDPAERHAVRDAVLRLHDAQRELVMLIHWDGFTIVEAAELLGLNASTARSRYAAARETLKRALEEPLRQAAEA
ncbi:sigma-70 family RNA polymerase sigma factor [Nocardioides caricicola]